MRIRLIASVLALATALAVGWIARSWIADRDLSRLQAQVAQAQQAQAQRYRASEQKAQALTDQLATVQAQAEQAAQAARRTVQQEVARYAQDHVTSDTGCRLDARWVQLHNAAARDLPPPADATGQSAAAPATPADALGTVTGNYALANTCEQRLQGWQAWYRQVKGVLDAQTAQSAESRH